MEFKFNSSVFKVSPDQHKEQKGDKYDPSKNYPNFEGTLSIPKGQLYALVEYLQYASGTELKHDSYINDAVIPIKVAGWAKESASGKKYLSLQDTACRQRIKRGPGHRRPFGNIARTATCPNG